MRRMSQVMSEPAAEQSLHQQLARRVRHEIGDFLQKVYATVAILQKRLPAECVQERELLRRLRSRAEVCKEQIDAIQDFLCPIHLALEPANLSQIAARAVNSLRPRFPQLDLQVDGDAEVFATGDPPRLARIGCLLLMNACEAAARHVRMTSRQEPGTGDAVWTITDDGPGVSTEVSEQIFQPFFTSRAGHVGLGLTVVQKLVLLHGGQVHAENLPGQGFQVTIRLPGCPK